VRRGRYRLVFHVGDYFRAAGIALPDPPFVDVVPIDFGIAEDGGSYHVPLVCTPWTYSTIAAAEPRRWKPTSSTGCRSSGAPST
jgi:5-hydroxyisourate hydrolase-like protein (transthyretin family)